MTEKKKRHRPPGVHFYPTAHELEALGSYGREQGLSISYLAAQMFHHGFNLWKNGEFTPQPSERARAMFASSKTAKDGAKYA